MSAPPSDPFQKKVSFMSETVQSSTPPKKFYPKASTVAVMSVVFIAGVSAILWAWNLWPFQTTTVTTENSYVRGQVTVLAPQVSGYITEVSVGDFAHVKKGDALFHIDDRIYRQQMDQATATLDGARANRANSEQTVAQNQAAILSAEAGVAQAQAECDRAAAELGRVENLKTQGVSSQKELEQARATARAADASLLKARAQVETARQTLRSTEVSRASLDAAVAQAQSAVDLARINLDNTVIRAPRDGQLSEATARSGQYVTAGSQLTFLVPDTVWVVANFKETAMARITLGQAVRFSVDGLADRTFTGHVEQIAPAAGSEFSVLKADNASGNFTKVVQRIPVRIAIDPNQPMADQLRPGMSVVTKIETGLPASVTGARA